MISYRRVESRRHFTLTFLFNPIKETRTMKKEKNLKRYIGIDLHTECEIAVLGRGLSHSSESTNPAFIIDDSAIESRKGAPSP